MSGPDSIVSLKDFTEHKKIGLKLKTMKKFSNKDYYKPEIRNEIVKKLEIDSKDYWKKFRDDIFNHLKKYSYVVITGLPFDENDRLSIGLASFIGEPVIQNNKNGGIIRTVKPLEGRNNYENFPHTDSVYWPKPNDLVTLQCVEEDQMGGGKSRIVPLETLLEKLKSEDTSLISKLFNHKYPFPLDPKYGKTGMYWKTILTKSKYNGKNYNYVRFGRLYIERSIKNYKINILNTNIDTLLTFEEIAKKIGKKSQFLLKKGEWLIFDNKRALHSKTSTSSGTNRILKKMKLNMGRKNL